MASQNSANTFRTTLIKEHAHTQARILEIDTPHGQITTPAFMPVGTKAVVTGMTPDDLVTTGSQIILGGNTFHMLCSPGLEIIEKVGGMHRFMGWDRPMLTDSGGFQVFSLSKKSDICKIDDEAATFRNPKSGKIIRMTPETSIEAQKIIGADIIMAFDHCTPTSDNKDFVEDAMIRTHRWLNLSKEYHEKNPKSAYGFHQALFGIIQGAGFRDLREKSTAFITSLDLDGVAIGGESIGYDMEKTVEILDWIIPMIPKNKPRYTMGVGANPQDLLNVIEKGIDMFDCVAPTRNARHGAVFSGKIVKKNGWVAFESNHPGGRINLNNQQYETDTAPIMEGCSCLTCSKHSRAYLRFLLKSESIDYFTLASIHNVQVMQDACKAARECIMENAR
ncbi:MAG: tRNA guanosine(34) transglycosylase Tgt [Pseudomonadota bacterium]